MRGRTQLAVCLGLLACSTPPLAADGGDDVCAPNTVPDATDFACDASAPDAFGCVGDPNDCYSSYCNVHPNEAGAVYPVGCWATIPQESPVAAECRVSPRCGCPPESCQCGGDGMWSCLR